MYNSAQNGHCATAMEISIDHTSQMTSRITVTMPSNHHSASQRIHKYVFTLLYSKQTWQVVGLVSLVVTGKEQTHCTQKLEQPQPQHMNRNVFLSMPNAHPDWSRDACIHWFLWPHDEPSCALISCTSNSSSRDVLLSHVTSSQRSPPTRYSHKR